MTRPVPRATTLLAVVVAMLAGIVGWPLVMVFGSAAAAGWRVATTVLIPLAFSMLVATAATIVTLALAVGLASAVTRGRIAVRGVVAAALVLLLVTPPATVALAIRFALDAGGALPLGTPAGALAVAVAQVVALTPHAFVVVVNALGRIGPDVEHAAVSLGAAPVAAFRRTTLALLRRGIGCAAGVVWALALTDLASPLLVGGAAPFLAPEVVAAVRQGRIDAASVGAAALTAPALVAWIVALRLGWTRLAPLATERLAGGSPAAAARRTWSVVATVIAGLMAVPALAMPFVWLRNTSTVAFDDVAAVIARGLLVAVSVAIAGTIAAFVVAIAATRSAGARSRAAVWLALSTAGVPGVALALGAVVAFHVSPASPAPWVLIALLAAWKLPAAVTLVTRRLDALDPALEEAAVSLGASEATIARRIMIPLVAPTAGAMFLDLVVQTLTSTGLLLLFAPDLVAAVAVVSRGVAGDAGGAAAVATVLGAVVLVVTLVRLRLVSREPLALLPA